MHRLTARLLLFLSLVGVFAPMALAAYASPPQTCCARKCCKGKGPHTHDSSGPAVQAPACCRQSCVCSLTVSQTADVAPAPASKGSYPSSILRSEPSPLLSGSNRHAAHSVRGPPQFSIA